MLLRELRVEQLRQFREPYVLDELSPGLNLLTGPNEAGKSTLVRAIRAAFFERHRSTTMQDLQPWGDSGAAPAIDLRFEHAGVPYVLSKRFVLRKRCDLSVGAQKLDGTDAEDHLARLLGFDFALKGASKPDHWGIPGLLWIEQGCAQELHASVAHAADHLRGALGGQTDELASSLGDAVLERVAARRAELLTPGTGKPAGAYRQAQADEAEWRAALAEIDGRLTTYQAQVDELAALRAEHQRDEREQPWLALRRRQEVAETALKDVASWQAELTRVEAQAQELSQRRALLQDQLEANRRTEEAQERRVAQLVTRRARVSEVREQVEAARLRAQQADVALGAARAAHQAAQRAARRHELHQQHTEALRQSAEQQALLDQARDHAARLQALRAQTVPVVIPPADVKALSAALDGLRDLAVQESVLATRMEVRLQPGQRVYLNGEALEGEAVRSLLDDTEIDVPGVGTLRLRPGGRDLASLAATRREHETRLTDLCERWQLQQRGPGLLDEAQARNQAAVAHAAELAQAEQTLRLLAPQGVEALEGRLAAGRLRAQALATELSVLSPAAQIEQAGHADEPQADAVVLAEQRRQAEAAEMQALREQQETQLALQTAREALATAEAALHHDEAECQRLAAELADPQRQAAREQARRQLAEVVAQVDDLARRVATQRERIDAAQPEALQRDVTRFRQSADLALARHRERHEQLIRLESTLQAEGTQGLAEHRADLQARLTQVQRRLAEYQLRAEALTLLQQRLQAHRQALTARLQAPLQTHLQRYLRLVFPQARLELDEHLHPRLLARGQPGTEEHADVHALSFGAREQLGIISRLAYADLLREAGRPTLIILDDALVHTDPARLDAMKRVLLDAAERHQILLFSCHPELWQDLGVPERRIGRGRSARCHTESRP